MVEGSFVYSRQVSASFFKKLFQEYLFIISSCRDYGFLNHIFHHIGDTHVAHHLFSTMPHYHAVEATKALKPILQEYYLSDDSSVLLGIWKSFYYCDDLREESTGGQRTLWFYS